MAPSTTAEPAEATAVAADPFAAATLEVKLPRLKRPPKKATLKRVGIVPDDVETQSENGGSHGSKEQTALFARSLPPRRQR
jgi:hypothetical protein